jgi:hypothetical protein
MKSFGALLGLFDRIPKFVLFGAAAVIQVALIVAMVADHVQILRRPCSTPRLWPPQRPPWDAQNRAMEYGLP